MYLCHCTERVERQFEQQLAGSVQSFIDAVQRVINRASYVILVVMTTSFCLRVAAVLMLRRLAATSARPQRRAAAYDAELDEQSVRADDVTDDDDDEFRCHCDVAERHGDLPPPPPITARQTGILHSLKYYETNV